MSNRLDMKKDTNNLKDKTKCDGPGEAGFIHGQ